MQKKSMSWIAGTIQAIDSLSSKESANHFVRVQAYAALGFNMAGRC